MAHAKLMEHDELSELQRKYDALDAEYNEFAYMVSHDVKAPLRSIQGFASLLQRKKNLLDERSQQHLNIIIEAASKAGGLMDNLLDYSRLSENSMNIELLNGDEIQEEALAQLSKDIARTQAVITCDQIAEISADWRMMVHLFKILLHNALTYQPLGNKPSIHIGYFQTNTHHHFSIKDNGIGLDPRNTKEVFTIFKRAVRHDEYEGSGCGLAYAQKIVRFHDGDIRIEPQKRGIICHFTISKTLKKEI